MGKDTHSLSVKIETFVCYPAGKEGLWTKLKPYETQVFVGQYAVNGKEAGEALLAINPITNNY